MVPRLGAVPLQLLHQPFAMAEVQRIRHPRAPGSLAQGGEISSKSCAIILFLFSGKTLADEVPLSRINAARMCHVYLLHLHIL